jgi:hypothetical protein
MEEGNEIKEEKENKKYEANLYYFNSTVKDYELPESFLIFKEDIKEMFNIDSNINDELSLFYTFLDVDKMNKEKKKITKVKTQEDYKEMRDRIQSKIEDKTILIEVEKDSFNSNRKVPETFEEEIQCVVEREIKDAAERIRKFLSSNSKRYPYSKKQDKQCYKCNGLIYGDIYKKAKEIAEQYYCEKCALDLNDDEPLFVIH